MWLSTFAAKDLHHAYLVIGAGDTAQQLHDWLRDQENDFLGPHNLTLFSYERLSVDDARQLGQAQYSKTGAGSQGIIIAADVIGIPAQNALLKVLEEPTEGTHFFVCLPGSHGLLDTFRSRCIEVLAEGEVGDGKLSAADFLAATPAKRIAMTEKLLKKAKDKDEKITRFEAVQFLEQLQELLVRDGSHKDSSERRFVLLEIQKGHDYLHDAGSSVKLILEHIALIL